MEEEEEDEAHTHTLLRLSPGGRLRRASLCRSFFFSRRCFLNPAPSARLRRFHSLSLLTALSPRLPSSFSSKRRNLSLLGKLSPEREKERKKEEMRAYRRRRRRRRLPLFLPFMVERVDKRRFVVVVVVVFVVTENRRIYESTTAPRKGHRLVHRR